MTTSTVTSKGQITIPADVRAKLGLRPGSRLAFIPNKKGGYEIHLEAESIQNLKGVVPQPTERVTLQDMDAAIAAGATAAAP